MASLPCTCRGLSPPPRAQGGSVVLFSTLRTIFERSQYCRHCLLIKISFEAALDTSEIETAVSESGKWSSIDLKIICAYEDDATKRIALLFQSPSWNVKLELFGVSGKPNTCNFTMQVPPKSRPGSRVSTEQAQRWIGECMSVHEACSSGDATTLPKRILDIGKDTDRVYLVEPSSGTIAKYACQSYCWGTSHTVTTTSGTYERHRNGVCIASLPKTFRDTIFFARSLGLNYLWIDSMCIIQDSVDDWRQEAAQMSNYYSNAYCTLAATMSTNADGGLFQENADITLSASEQTWIVRAHRHLNSANEDTATLFGRGWIFQERLLSPRVVHFGTTEMVFECNVLRTCECGQDMPDQGWYAKQEYLHGPEWKTYRPTLADTWRRTVEAYSRLRLTVPSDKLPALSGLADHMGHRRGGSSYLAGLWQDSILPDMLWSTRSTSGGLSVKLEPSRAPSWSWASVSGQVRYGNYPRLDVTYCKVLDAYCDCVPPSTTGQVRSGYLIVKGPTVSGLVLESRTLCVTIKGREPLSGHLFPDYQLGDNPVEVCILRVGLDPHGLKKEYLLVLKQINDGGSFERVALFEGFVSGSQWANFDWGQAQETTLRIV